MTLSWCRVLATVVAVFGFVLAVSAAELDPRNDFRTLDPPLPVDTRGKIEVTEFFWYGCPHCFDFEPVLAAWVKKLPADVVFRRIPAIFPGDRWAPSARLYYTLEAMNLHERLHGEVFNAIHEDRVRLDDESVAREWMAMKGINVRRFSETYASFGVQSRVKQAKELTQTSDIGGVPAVMVQGRYLAVTPGSYADLLKIVDQLIDKVRRESAAKK